MSVGKRVADLRKRHGHSRVAAEERTGVSRETIRRIEEGETPSSLRFHLERIAGGYGVPVECLLEGHDPKGDFEWLVLQAPPIDRLNWAIMTLQERLHMVLGFLSTRYPVLLDPVGLAAATGVLPAEILRLLRGKGRHDRNTCIRVSKGVCHLTGIDLHWVLTGFRSDEKGLTCLDAALHTLQIKATKAGVGNLVVRGVSVQLRSAIQGTLPTTSGESPTHSAG